MALTHLWLFATLFFVPKDTFVEALPRCPPALDCSSGECPPPPSCPHGYTTDYCGRQICLKGPGEICGQGMFRNVYGTCGDGMFCRCGRCTGCSIKSLECFYKTCVTKDN